MHDSLKKKHSKTVILTGGLKGIGLSISKALLKKGYSVVCGSRSYVDVIKDENFYFKKTDVKYEEDHISLVKEAITISNNN